MSKVYIVQSTVCERFESEDRLIVGHQRSIVGVFKTKKKALAVARAIYIDLAYHERDDYESDEQFNEYVESERREDGYGQDNIFVTVIESELVED